MTTTTHRRITTAAIIAAAFFILHSTFSISASADAQPWRDPSLPVETRVAALVSQMTLTEKISQIGADPLAIPRLGIPAYSHRNEAIHGVMTARGEDEKTNDGHPVTAFPQAIGMAATWNTTLIQQEADAIATEARARYNDYSAAHNGNIVMRYGLTYYSPNINIFRDPRWGRGQETYGEDPFLTAQMGVAYIRGLQGDDPRYIKILACAKHYAVHSGPEKIRHSMNAEPPERDLYETYLPAFEAAVRDAKVGSVMGVYSALYGKPGCASPFLIQDLLRGQWGFNGLHISDGGAIWDIWGGHHYKPTPEECVAAAIKAGCDMASGNVNPSPNNMKPDAGFLPTTKGWSGGGMNYNMLLTARAKNLVTDADIDRAVTNELTSRFRVGIFDPLENSPWRHLTQATHVDTPAHRALAEKVAEQSIVLLKNDVFPSGNANLPIGTTTRSVAPERANQEIGAPNPAPLLPLDRSKYKRIAVIGPNADSKQMLFGNYTGASSQAITILEGIKQLAGPNTEVTYARGGPMIMRKDKSNAPKPADITRATDAAKSADLVIFVSGIDGKMECEENRKVNVYEGMDTGDRVTIELPAVQHALIQKLHALGKPIVLVNCSGSPMAMPWEAANLPAIVQAWYPGQSGGTAVARVLFGEVNPAGRLPVTFYAATTDLPKFENYSMQNRTYRYFTGKPLYAFGHGLSYTTFAYENAKLNKTTHTPTDTIKLTFTLKNTGLRDGDEVPQVYFRHVNSAQPQPKQSLCAFTRVTLGKNSQKQITLEIPAARLRYYDTAAKRYTIEPGDYELLLAAASDDIRATLPFSIK